MDVLRPFNTCKQSCVPVQGKDAVTVYTPAVCLTLEKAAFRIRHRRKLVESSWMCVSICTKLKPEAFKCTKRCYTLHSAFKTPTAVLTLRRVDHANCPL